jgi:hypothetical protein
VVCRRREPLLEGDEVRFVTAYHAGDDEQDFAHRGAASAGDAFALMFAAVVGHGATPASLEMVLLDQGPDLRHFGHDAGDGAVGHALDGAEGLIELAPQRVGGQIRAAMAVSSSSI